MKTIHQWAIWFALFWIGVTGCKSVPDKHDLKTITTRYRNGNVKKHYSYYLDAKGNKVLQDIMLEYSPPGGPIGDAIFTRYDHGKIIEGPVFGHFVE